jgi:cyclophilin family peptidyl-prolyl cis-trans isomerase
MNRISGAGLAAAVCLAAHARGQMAADFQTSLGNFSIELYFQDVPRTVANFVSLADGTQTWWDARTNRLRVGVPFYDGLTFHRVIPGFMIQSGSPLGDGSDDAGYELPDEFHKDANGQLLHRHSGPGILSMANLEVPHTGGSQIFVTVSAQPGLDDVHTVFGKVSDGPGGVPTFDQGMSVVNAIANVPRNGDDKPNVDVIIQHVAIRREGAAAQAFAPSAWQLPQLRPLPITLRYLPAAGAGSRKFSLGINLPQFSAFRYAYSADLDRWNYILGYPIFDHALVDIDFDVTPEATGPTAFFQCTQIDYSNLIAKTLPVVSENASIKFKFVSPFAFELTINRAPNGGTWTENIDPPSGLVAFSNYGAGDGDAGLFSPTMNIVFDQLGNIPANALLSMLPTLTFNAGSATDGNFTTTVTLYDGSQGSAAGIFTVLTP